MRIQCRVGGGLAGLASGLRHGAEVRVMTSATEVNLGLREGVSGTGRTDGLGVSTCQGEPRSRTRTTTRTILVSDPAAELGEGFALEAADVHLGDAELPADFALAPA